MIKKFDAVSAKVPKMMHGADYNPEQWKDYPDVLAEDIRLMKLANCNVMSMGMFSWSSLEPTEGQFTFDFLDHILDEFAKNDIYVYLATPSGARPAWMAEKYPEVLRVGPNRVRNLYGHRHNHCYTSPVYREKVTIMNQKLAERYAHHPAVIGWHISNEYGGECHCEYCQQAFRDWVKDKYQSLDQLNHAWWTAFWSHTYSDFSQVESPAPHGETLLHGLNLDWKRFVTDQTIDFYRHEVNALKQANPDLPCTTNFMLLFDQLDYAKFAKELDFVCWDSYPAWHSNMEESDTAAWIAFNHDMFRSFKDGQPFLLMESTPSTTNWQDVSKLKRPGMHKLSSLQAVAHGSDSVQYFQWRKSRGANEKFHGAVVDHYGAENNRVFSDVQEVGAALEKLTKVVGTTVDAEVAVIFDTENRWAVKDAEGPRNIGINYEETVFDYYKALWENHVNIDVISMDKDFSKYKIVVAPMLYMMQLGVGERLEKFVEAGGILVTTYWSGIVNNTDLCFLNGFPGPLRQTLGIRSEEIDSLHDGQTNGVKMNDNNRLGLDGEYIARELCDLIHLEGAEALAYYTKDFYAGRPALTVNAFGKGKAFYVASRNDRPFYNDFLTKLIDETGVKRVLQKDLPKGVHAHSRTDGENEYIFIMNFNEEETTINLTDIGYTNILDDDEISDTLILKSYGVKVIERSLK
ncbi:beta-galactosidase [Paraliobacillus salinarum]|uniref:beta-galactosidase n=1 Tax=Paraliobacillus salinarum TaxID=1158996 RepID=UPI0015F37BB2|nr:beta-galactosidase [Paraliobacillus salinarum]